MATYTDVILFSLMGGLLSLVGGMFLLGKPKITDRLIRYVTPFAAGALLGAAFFDLLPEAVESQAKNIFTGYHLAVGGIILFFLLEHYLHWFHHHHEHEEKRGPRRQTVPLIIIGDTVHNVLDGIVIGAAFLVSFPLGVVTAFAVAAHEIPQEIGDFGLLLKSGMKRSRVLFWNVLSALATTVAALVTFGLGVDGPDMSSVLGIASGFFIYIAASDLLPTIHEEAKGRFAKAPAILLVLGVLVVGGVTEFAHEKLRETENNIESSQHE